ncbi:uncharacterized protein LOC125548368 [Triticum urartu]|uniref:uncharacterized protein LOC125548368 n=1 Tax=Triticum urartu TaxID=4572 RepID=UPI002042F5FC|nr:uncharacterized protein LOC125548368 [Triticum urartu]
MGSERARSEGVGSSAEHPKSAGGEAGDAHHTDKSPRRNPLRDWSDDDEETLTHVGGEATPRGGDGIIDPPKAADAGSSHASAATSRPHGKADVAPRKPTAKRTADPAAAGRPPVKKRRRAVPVALMRPSVSMVVGSPLALVLAVIDVVSGGGFAFRRSRSSAIDRDKEVADEDLILNPTTPRACPSGTETGSCTRWRRHPGPGPGPQRRGSGPSKSRHGRRCRRGCSSCR